MKTTPAVIVFAVIFLFILIFASPRAQAQGGVPLWTNRYSDPVTGSAVGWAVAVDSSGNVFVTGSSGTNGPDTGFVTIKYSSANPPPVHLTIERDGSSGYFIRFYGSPGSTYRLQGAASVTGPWSNLVTNTAPASGLIEYHETDPAMGARFYRALQP